jgi:CHAT domain-containing protein
VLHLACHGIADPNDPLSSALELGGGERLTLADVLARPAGTGRLAVLSACETGVTGSDLPDEAVGLPSGFLAAGFAGVVSSMWQVLDESTALLIGRFYQAWLHEGLAPDRALREAQQWLRDSTNHQKTMWLRDAALRSHRLGLPFAALNHLYQTVGVRERDERSYSRLDNWAAFSYLGAPG